MRRTYHHRLDLSAGSLEDPVILPNVPMFVSIYIYLDIIYNYLDIIYNYLYLQGMISKMRMTGGPDLLASANAFLEAQDPPQHVFEKRTVSKYLNGISTLHEYFIYLNSMDVRWPRSPGATTTPWSPWPTSSCPRTRGCRSCTDIFMVILIL